MNLQDKKTQKTLIFVLVFILLGLVAFYGTYYFFTKKSLSTYEKNIHSEINTINSLNESTPKFIKGQTIDNEKILNELPSLISSLKTSEQKSKGFVVMDKYKSDHENLLKGLKDNISLYEQIYLVCKNPKSKTLKNNLNLINKFKDNCMNEYSLVSIKRLKIALPKECLDFINNTIFFIEKQIRQNTDNEIAHSQNKEFLNSLTTLVDNFNSINKNFSEEINKAQQDSSLYNELINKITTTKYSIDKIKSKASNITVPQDSIMLYNYFTKVLDDYSSYIEDLKYAVKTEMLTPLPEQKNKSLTNLYESSNNKFYIFTDDYAKFTKEYNNLKNKSLSQ
ncbi:hypothetical protein RBU49_16535 [Clostridium sp. MB40-C1]|uniref:hypothetical protein n=1 Tax=Clostridium sp. MB40-C1 TaxID=3070996 RepID=UPI0027DF26A0|nr:hypothetical protein [Clostridium sp. MB40-C1]WMJ80389.1 hypothetical protein RBU49_16535 [Clostridium sp. MB40-C1]